MKTVLKTNQPATLNFAQVVLKDAGIANFVLDDHISTLEGSIGIFPKRLAVASDEYDAACQALEQAGLEKEIYRGA